MARKLKVLDLERTAELEKKKASLARAQKRIIRLQQEVARLAKSVDTEVKEGLQPGWYVNKEPDRYARHGTARYMLVLNVKHLKVTDKRDPPYEIRNISVDVGQLSSRVVYVDESGNEHISSSAPQGCTIHFCKQQMSYARIAGFVPIPALQLVVKHGLAEALILANAPKKVDDDERNIICDIGGSWLKVVGIVDENPYHLFDY